MLKRWLCGVLFAVLLLGLFTGFSAQASDTPEMTASDALIAYLKTVERFEAKPYWDNSQYSMGYGSFCSYEKNDTYWYYMNNPLTEEKASELLVQQLQSYINEVREFVTENNVKVNQNQFDALVSFTYNCGGSWTREMDGYFNKAVRSGDMSNALLYGFCLWSSAGGEYILVDRRMSEANMYITGEYKPYNTTSPAYPDNFRWVFLDGNGGQVQYRICGFDATNPVPITVNLTQIPTGVDSSGKPFTCKLAGWFTADGTKVEILDSSVSKGQVLYAKWTDPDGNVMEIPKGDLVGDLLITVTGNGVNIRSGPGTFYPVLSTADRGTTLTMTRICTTSSYTWGKTERGWICLSYTNYETLQSLNGWYKENDRWVYYEKGIKVVSQWRRDSKDWCYLGADGYLATDQWACDSIGWRYVGADGYCVSNCWKRDSVGWCYLDENGRLVTNKWVSDNVGLCYVDKDGHSVTNCWQADSRGRRYLDAEGRVVKNAWFPDGQGLCYADAEGYQVSSAWIRDGQTWRYVGADGYCVTNTWQRDSVGFCYLDENGRLAINRWAQDGAYWYYVGTGGYRVKNAWRRDSVGWCYLNADGKLATNRWVRDSAGWCYVDKDGHSVTNCWQRDSVGWCYLDAEGRAVTSAWLEDGGNRYYMDAEGRRVTGTQTIEGKVYHFDASGVLTG